MGMPPIAENLDAFTFIHFVKDKKLQIKG